MNKQLNKRILTIVRKHCAVKPKKLKIDSLLVDLALDSLSFVALIVDLESEFLIEFPDDKLSMIAYTTVANIAETVVLLIADLLP
jgi:acyl carrier protein